MDELLHKLIVKTYYQQCERGDPHAFERFEGEMKRRITTSENWLAHQRSMADAFSNASPGASIAAQNLSTAPIGETRAIINEYILRVFRETGRKIKRKDLWQVAGYKGPTEFERFQRGDPKTTASAVRNFTRVLKMPPGTFIEMLGRKQLD